ncbi:hypothetical protein LU003_06290 [Neisseria gonorrhoeae]|uniref:hypothetical protein n=1 Tax=Neisseria gonorrhoeae TaxID=485 RepID=UPI001F3EB64C|nr:hypothetical protein [Neisseria gonorrhoeae]MCF3008096.1 hypothetical protein [Neisseria gonorrhoeae]MCF3021068.1 hypothetical protein [Neisseria gonorrhoeae]
MTEPKHETPTEEQVAARKCAMSKPQAKQKIVESCMKNIPFAEKWQNDLKARGLDADNTRLAVDYCKCMWEQPLDGLSEKQISSFGKLGAQEQLDLLGGANAFETRDKQCVADLKAD